MNGRDALAIGPLPANIVEKIDVGHPQGCWWWIAGTNRGYGRACIGSKRYYAHRLVYELLVAPIAEGLELDHLCKNKRCVNPDHLEPVTGEENWRRGRGRGAYHREKTHCPQGHPYDEANTYNNPGRGRVCRVCMRAAGRRYYSRKNRRHVT